VLFLATANRLDTLPPDSSAASTGNLVLDVPSDTERASIWKIQTKRFGLEWRGPARRHRLGGRDIRQCCQTAYMLRASLKEAAQWITLVGRTARADIERLASWRRTWASSAANQRALPVAIKETNGRAIKL